MGFSNGASMAFRVGVELSARIAAIAPFAGALWIEQPELDRPVSLYYITGDADPLNPLEGGDAQACHRRGLAGHGITGQAVRERTRQDLGATSGLPRQAAISSPATGASYGLRGCRSIRPSPFPDEAGRVWYFGGFDQTGARGQGAIGPAAWICRAALKSEP